MSFGTTTCTFPFGPSVPVHSPAGVKRRRSQPHLPLWAERAALEERLLVVDAALVDVQPRLHVVERVAHAGEAAPEGVVEDALLVN